MYASVPFSLANASAVESTSVDGSNDVKPASTQASPVPEENPQYWAAVRRAAALGRTADAQDLLGLHSAFARFGEPRQRELVQPLVRAMNTSATCLCLYRIHSPSCVAGAEQISGLGCRAVSVSCWRRWLLCF